MRLNETHLFTIGPWGYLGWLLFGMLTLLYFRLWRSTGVGELQNLKTELERARKLISQLRQAEMSLKNRNSELVVKVNSLIADNRDLKHAVDVLKKANELQGETINRMDKYQRELGGRVEYLVGRVIQLDAERGMVTKLPWNE